MGEMVRLRAGDGHELDAYRAEPDAPTGAGVVVIQEVFGLTGHIRRVVDRFAAAGFAAIAPAMFDRVGPGIVYEYTELEKGRETMCQLEWPNTMADVAAARRALDGMTVGIVGFCWGGTVVHVAASELPFAAGVSYYGSAIARMLDRKPKCPVLYHFGAEDASIPPDAIESIKKANPDGTYYVYPGAQHGFSCEDRASFSAEDAAAAFERTRRFLRSHMTAA